MGHALRIVTIVNGRELSGPEAERVRIEASYGLKAGAIIEETHRLRRRDARLSSAPERRSIARAMLAVEERLVQAFWTIARQPIPVNASPRQVRRCGIDYFHDRTDSFARFADAAGGKWDSVQPRAPLPSSKAIDDANAALDWLLFVEERRRKILVAGATSKRGDAGRNINWSRIRDHLPEFADCTTRTLQDRYRQALREIVTELTLARIVKVA